MSRRTPDAGAELADRMRELVDRSGLGVATLAQRTGRTEASWDAYLCGRLLPPAEAVAGLADALGADPGPLLAQWERARVMLPAPRPDRTERATAGPHGCDGAGGDGESGGGPHGGGARTAAFRETGDGEGEGPVRPGGHRTAVLVMTALGVALVVLAVVLLTALGGDA